MIRAILLLLILYTGPGSPLPTHEANKVIYITVPSVLSIEAPSCAPLPSIG